MSFILKNTDLSMANALRRLTYRKENISTSMVASSALLNIHRVMIAEVPTMAIDLVEVEANSSSMHSIIYYILPTELRYNLIVLA